ncbi:MAG: multidrug effflux MFS transporter [Anaerolineales bacterium]|nr:multidrug effflux MFS transporter [Anaerolineales bacterium]
MKQKALGFTEFVALMASMMALAALSTDAMLPALRNIGEDLGVVRENSSQLIVSFLFLGMAVGQIAYGPVSDSVGRKPTIYAGYVLYIAGCLLSIFAPTFSIMLAGRLLQGVGIAGPRSVTMALVRDQFEGRAMARVMSFVMSVFILVPVIAPSFGQAILLMASWRAIFGALLALALITALWFAIRHPETLPVERRIPFSGGRIWNAIREIFAHRPSLGYTLAAGLVTGAFSGYLNSAQQIFQEQYGLGTKFPLYFAVIALALGGASFTNGRLVMRFGMRALSGWSAQALVVLSVGFVGIAFAMGGQPSLTLFMTYLMASFFAIGILFGNLNALAMEPLGHIAGVGAAVVGSLSTFISVPLGIVIGQAYDGTVLPLVAGFAVLSVLSFGIMKWAEGKRALVKVETSHG